MFGSRFAELDLTRGVSERLAAGIADMERAGSARRSFTGTSADMAAALSSRGMGHVAFRPDGNTAREWVTALSALAQPWPCTI
jgi:hypothetical protein